MNSYKAMRLTVGGVIIILGIGATAGYLVADGGQAGGALEKIKGLTTEAGSLVGLMKSGEEKKEVYAPPPPFPNGVADQVAGTANTTPTPAAATNEPVQVAALPVEAVEPAADPEATVAAQPTKKKGRRKKKGKKTAAKAPAKSKKGAAKPAAAKSTVPPLDTSKSLIGTYVSLDLITGRSVQGILESKSATHYTLNVPGLGPLDYPIENVKSIVPAQ